MALPAVDLRHLSSQAGPRQLAKSVSRILAEAEEQWIFNEDELLKTPSIQDGMSVDKERELRAKGTNFIRQVGIMLKLPELTLSTAAIFFNRFLMRVTLVDKPGVKALHHYTLGATCLFLATKIEESCRKMKDMVIACCRVAQKNPNLVIDEQSKDFWKWRDTILLNEDVLLETLCFDLTIEAPHKQLFGMLKYYRVEHNKNLRNAAWAFVTDSNMTQLCLLCNSRTIAAAALYAGARLVNVRLPDTHDRPWWEEQGVRLREMVRATNYMCVNYESPPAKNDVAGTGSLSGIDGQSIYVGLFTELDGAPLPDGEEVPWDRTRLKNEQGILGSPVVAVGVDYERRGSADSRGSTKRAREGDGAETNRIEKKRKVPEKETNGHGTVDEPRKNGMPLPAVQEKDDASEEGEVEE